MKSNKTFTNRTLKSTLINTKNKVQKEYQLITDDEVAEDLNTYKNFGVFKTFNDVSNEQFKYEKGSQKNTAESFTGTPGVRSIFNKYSSVLTGSNQLHINLEGIANQSKALDSLVNTISEFRISNNVPLLDNPETRRKLRKNSGCTIKELVSASKEGMFGRAVYSYADFMYCRHLGVMPNNHLITLRRYPVPVSDSMQPTGTGKTRLKEGKADVVSPISTMVTWLGVSGNEIKNILKYDFKMAFSEANARWEEVDKIGGGDSGLLNGMEAAMNPNMRKAFMGGTEVPVLNQFMGKFFPVANGPYPYQGDWRDQGAGKVYGPIDRVKKNYQRSEEGLDWNMKFDLVFEYELKAYNGINPKQAMLDLIANILSTCYVTGGFWAGGYKGGGMRQASAFSQLNIFKQHGSFTGFMDAFSKDVRAASSSVVSFFTGGTPLDAIKTILNVAGGMLIGGLLNKFGRPARYRANSLLSEAPVGLWHITIGNPWHPIMSMGNMILTNTTIEHDGPLGLDDFPTRLKVTCSFDRGKPRDQLGVEALYMNGNDRIYHSMSKKVLDMYNAGYEYKSGSKTNSTSIEQAETQALIDTKTTQVTDDSQKLGNLKTFLQQAFGDYDTKAVIWASREQAEGAFKQITGEKEEKEAMEKKFKNNPRRRGK